MGKDGRDLKRPPYAEARHGSGRHRRYIAPLVDDPPPRGPQKFRQQIETGGFAGAVGPNERMNAAARDAQVYPVDRDEARKFLCEILGLKNDILAHGRGPVGRCKLDSTFGAGKGKRKKWSICRTLNGGAGFLALSGITMYWHSHRQSAILCANARQRRASALRLLVIEDDPDLNRQLVTALTDAGYVVDRAFDGEEGHFLGETEPYDAVILDIGLPKMDGISVLEAWRRAGRAMPVLMLTARDRWSDKVQGFDAGADDYVAKPFHLEEVLARIRALLRRSAGHAKSELNCGSVRLDTRTGRVTVDGNPVKLTSHEYRLLSYLMHHSGRVVSRSELVEHLYDQDFDRDSNTIEVFVGRIRRKLGVDVIQTVRGLGYLLAPPGDAS